ncbi:MAG: ABC transporter [Bacteroidetes bacterium HGW-Bacteroidetes-6]|jgi:ABC-2 type transport system permease protein|nr:MAG: ABC transporter [Bacteroidetes bacterium HGW-Bacteroidetes-6]
MNTANILLIERGIIKLVKQPSAPLMGFGMSLFFLLVYNAGIGGIGSLEAFGKGGYLSFVFPITIISLAMGSSAGAGQTLNADMQSGYFRRLYLSPVPRWILVLAPMLADTISSLFFTILLIVIGALFGVTFQFGLASVFGILLLSFLWSLTLCGFSVGIMLRTGQHQSAAIITNAVFPLLFLSTTFLPRELITAKWLLAVSWGNPVTYILEGNRYLLGGTSSAVFFHTGIIMFALTAVVSVIFALSSAKKIRI